MKFVFVRVEYGIAVVGDCSAGVIFCIAGVKVVVVGVESRIARVEVASAEFPAS
jgi:hypothetical protein